jgi:hypothetical protein
MVLRRLLGQLDRSLISASWSECLINAQTGQVVASYVSDYLAYRHRRTLSEMAE